MFSALTLSNISNVFTIQFACHCGDILEAKMSVNQFLIAPTSPYATGHSVMGQGLRTNGLPRGLHQPGGLTLFLVELCCER